MNPSDLLDRVRRQLFLHALRQTESLPPPSLEAYQDRLLAPLVHHARSQVPFYHERLKSVLRDDGTIDRDAFRAVPILSREEARDDPERLFAAKIPDHAGGVSSDATSGSTGSAFVHRRNTMADTASYCLTERTYQWAGIDLDTVLADIRVDRLGIAGPPLGRRSGPWSLTGAGGRSVRLAIDAEVSEQIDWLLHHAPDYLLSYPSNLRAIAEECEDRGIRLPLKGIITGSETLEADTRALLGRIFGCNVTDNYGSQEVGYIAGECPGCGQYHTAAESILLEVLDDDGNPVAPGQIGRVVLTSLYNYAMPFIRYEIGDYARQGEPEGDCGRTLPRLARVMGRTRNMFRFPGGRTIWPNAFQKDIRHYLPIRRMQVIQRAPLEIVVRFTRDANGVETDMQGLTAYLRGKLDPRITVELDEIPAFARNPGMKFEDYLSLC